MTNEIAEENGMSRSSELVTDGVGSGVATAEKKTISELVSCWVMETTLEISKLNWEIGRMELGKKVLREGASSDDGSWLILPSVRVVGVEAIVSDGDGRKEVVGKKSAVVAKKMSLVSTIMVGVGMGDGVSVNKVSTMPVGIADTTGVLNDMGVVVGVKSTGVEVGISNMSVSMMDVSTTVGVEVGISNVSVNTMDVSTTVGAEVGTPNMSVSMMDVSTNGVEVRVSKTSVSTSEVSNVAVGMTSEGVASKGMVAVGSGAKLGVKMLTPSVSSGEDIGSSRDAERCTDDVTTVDRAVGVATIGGTLVGKSLVCTLVVSSNAKVEGEKKTSDVVTGISLDTREVGAGENDAGWENVDVLMRDCVGVAPSGDDVTLLVMKSDESGANKMKVDSANNMDVLSMKGTFVVASILGIEEGAIGEVADGSGIKMDVCMMTADVERTIDEEADGRDIETDACMVAREVEAAGVGVIATVGVIASVEVDTKREGRIVAEEKTREGEMLSDVDVTANVGVDVGMSISDGTVKDGNGGDGVGVITMSTAVVSMTTITVVLKGLSMVSISMAMSTLMLDDKRGEERREERGEVRAVAGNTREGSDVGTTLVGILN